MRQPCMDELPTMMLRWRAVAVSLEVTGSDSVCPIAVGVIRMKQKRHLLSDGPLALDQSPKHSAQAISPSAKTDLQASPYDTMTCSESAQHVHANRSLGRSMRAALRAHSYALHKLSNCRKEFCHDKRVSL